MAFQFIKPEDLTTSFNDAKTKMLPFHTPLDEYERIARNKPWPGIPKNMPKVTDGTLSALIQDQPKRVIQQIPTGVVKTKEEWLQLVASFILEHEILPNAEQVADLIQKCWGLVQKTLTYGSQPTLVQFVQRGTYFGTDFTLPYIKDVILEPGKLTDRDSNVIYLRSWYSENQIRQIIYKEQELAKMAKKRGDSYKSTWNTAVLEKMLEIGAAQKDVNSQTPDEKNKMTNAGFYELVTAFQRGVGANFYTFAPSMPDSEDNLARTKKNPDPRGEIPIHFMYANIDFSNPLGRGLVEISGPLQNLLDTEMQSYQYMRSLLINPPIEKRGNFNKSQLKYEPGAVWDLGSNTANQATPVKLETQSLEQFPTNSQQIRNQILNLNSGGGDTSIGSDVSGPGQSSKTPAGVKESVAKLGISDNYIRKQFEACFSQICETAVNLYFAERQGIAELEVDKETGIKLEKLKPGSVKNGVIRIDYTSETPKLKFQVDAGSSSQKETAEQLDKAYQVLELSQQYPALDKKQGGDINVHELSDRIIGMIGLENPEKIVAPVETDPETGEPIEGEQAQPQMSPEMVMEMIDQALQEERANKPQEDPLLARMKALGIKFSDLDAEAQQAVLESVQLPSDGRTKAVIEAEQKQQEIDLKRETVEQQGEIAAVDTRLKAADQAQRIEDSQRSHELAQAQAVQGARRDAQSHELAVKTTEQKAKEARQLKKQPVGAIKK